MNVGSSLYKNLNIPNESLIVHVYRRGGVEAITTRKNAEF